MVSNIGKKVGVFVQEVYSNLNKVKFNSRFFSDITKIVREAAKAAFQGSANSREETVIKTAVKTNEISSNIKSQIEDNLKVSSSLSPEKKIDLKEKEPIKENLVGDTIKLSTSKEKTILTKNELISEFEKLKKNSDVSKLITQYKEGNLDQKKEFISSLLALKTSSSQFTNIADAFIYSKEMDIQTATEITKALLDGEIPPFKENENPFTEAGVVLGSYLRDDPISIKFLGSLYHKEMDDKLKQILYRVNPDKGTKEHVIRPGEGYNPDPKVKEINEQFYKEKARGVITEIINKIQNDPTFFPASIKESNQVLYKKIGHPGVADYMITNTFGLRFLSPLISSPMTYEGKGGFLPKDALMLGKVLQDIINGKMQIKEDYMKFSLDLVKEQKENIQKLREALLPKKEA